MAEETLTNAAPESTTATVEAALEVEKPAPKKESPPPPEPEMPAPKKESTPPPEPEKPAPKKESTPPPEPEKPAPVAAEAEEKPKAAAPAADEQKIAQLVSFKEESNVAGELPEPQKKALEELKQLIRDALSKHEFKAPPPPPPPAKEEVKPKEKEPKEKPAEAQEPAKEEKKEESESAAADAAAAATANKEAEKTEEKVESVEAKEQEKVQETVVVETVAVTEVAADDDGAKTVEAIEETIVAVTAASAEVGESSAAVVEAPSPPEEVSIWGIPLLQDERSDVVLLKFLRARDFKVSDAFAMIRSTVRWREEFGIEALLTEDLGCDALDKVVFMHGVDKEGHPVCYNVYGEFQNKELYHSTFSDEEKRQKFLRWRIQFLEKSIRKLDFSPTGISTIVQVNDLKNSPGPFKWELRQATNQALHLLQDNYPEFVAKQVFVNVPWWYLAVNKMITPFLTQRTKSKFVFAGASKSADVLFRYVAPEQVPLQYGGLSKAASKEEEEQEFTVTDAVTEITIKPSSKHTVEFPFTEAGVLVWAVRVVGWDVNFGAEFVPSAEDGYTVIVQKTRKVTPADETVIVDSFKIGEPGKVMLTIDNQSSKKKKLLYRSKTKPYSD